MSETPRPTCFVAMPFGCKAPPGADAPRVDFDAIYSVIKSTVEATGLECIRADFELNGGFIQRSMFERLLLAEYVVADLSFANPNVLYEIGLRHGGSTGPTLLIAGSNEHFPRLPFDIAPLRVLPYSVTDDGALVDPSALADEVKNRLTAARCGEWPPDNPLLQLTSIRPAPRVEHEKTDAFIARTRFLGAKGEQIDEARRFPREQRTQAIERLLAYADELLAPGPDSVRQLYSLLLAVYLGLRDHKAYAEMISLEERLPTQLRAETVVKEQLIFALNRLAEATAENGHAQAAVTLRERAMRTFDQIPEVRRTSETYGIIGRVYKGAFRACAPDDPVRRVWLDRAIEEYERGFRADMNDYYPGVNAVTSRVVREGGVSDDLERLLHAVRFSVDRAPSPTEPLEQYWQSATKLELACVGRDWSDADRLIAAMDTIRSVPDWAKETTADNFADLASAFADDPMTSARILVYSERLRPGGRGGES